MNSDFPVLMFNMRNDFCLLFDNVSGEMVRLDLGEVVLRRMQEKDIEAVKALIKVRFNTGGFFVFFFILFICPFSHLNFTHEIFIDKNIFI